MAGEQREITIDVTDKNSLEAYLLETQDQIEDLKELVGKLTDQLAELKESLNL